jgi:hypothetical protein
LTECWRWRAEPLVKVTSVGLDYAMARHVKYILAFTVISI